MALPYIGEVTVMGVDDVEFGQRVAAACVLRENLPGSDIPHANKITIDGLRNHLSGSLARYKMPTLLRIVEGELPKSATGKVSKKVLGPQLFPSDYRSIAEVQVWESGGGSKAKL